MFVWNRCKIGENFKCFNLKKIILHLSILYLCLPFAIFSIGWMHSYIAIPLFIILVICYFRLINEISMQIPKLDIKRDDLAKITLLFLIFALWVYLSGIGKFVFQNPDHNIRNGIFNILVEYKWPIVNSEIITSNFPRMEKTSLVYYIGFWLPAAIIGKIFGIRVGYYSQALWALLGIILVYYFICCYLKKIAILPAFLMICWSGLDVVGQYLFNGDWSNLIGTLHLEWWAIPYEYSGMTTQLFWVFNQAIPIWLCTIIIFLLKDNRNLVFILSLGMLTSTIPFIGLFMIVVFLIFTRKSCNNLKRNPILENIKKSLTFVNVVGGGCVGIFSFLYLSQNIAGTHIMQYNDRGPMYADSLFKYVLFLIIEVGVYIVLVYRYQKSNPLFYFITICLCIIPLVKVGDGNDFCMRASIPALFILMLYVMDSLVQSKKNGEFNWSRLIVVICLLGSITSLNEIVRTTATTNQRINEGNIVYEEDVDNVTILNEINFSGNIDNSFFFNYIAKKTNN